jgi:hypothetical protein
MTTEKQKTTEKKAPAFVIYEVVNRNGKKYWNGVGAAFKHGKGDGLNLVYNNGARQVLMPPTDNAAEVTEATGGGERVSALFSSFFQKEKIMETRYEVQTWTICDGWINTWSIIEDHAAIPETFANRKEAQEALDEFLSDINAVQNSQNTVYRLLPRCGFWTDSVRMSPVHKNSPFVL